MLVVENIGYKNLFNNINFSIENGIILFFGASGTGKSTLLEIIGGFKKANSGKVYFKEKKYKHKIKQGKIVGNKNKIGIHFQDYKLLDLDVKSNINLQFIINGYKKDKDWISFLIKYLKIEKIIDKDIKKISGGEKERISIVRALSTKPKILLLDEAGASLDDDLKEKLFSLIENYSKENIVILVSHDKELKNKFKTKIYKGNFGIYKKG